MAYKKGEKEYRSTVPFAVVGEEEKELVLRGSPVVFNKETVLFEYDGIKYKEIIDDRALNECDMSNFIFNRNHGNNDATIYARTSNQSIKYTITDKGLECEFLLDQEDERHQDLYRDIKKRRIDAMSFSFVIGEECYNVETHTRTILKIKKLYDVSAVDFPAYKDTELYARSLIDLEKTKLPGGNLADSEARETRRKKLILKTFL